MGQIRFLRHFIVNREKKNSVSFLTEVFISWQKRGLKNDPRFVRSEKLEKKEVLINETSLQKEDLQGQDVRVVISICFDILYLRCLLPPFNWKCRVKH